MNQYELLYQHFGRNAFNIIKYLPPHPLANVFNENISLIKYRLYIIELYCNNIGYK